MPVIAYGQDYNLNQLLEKAKTSYPVIKAKQYEVKSAQEKIGYARADYLPNFIVADQYTYSTSNNVEGAFYPNEGTAFAPSGGIRQDNIYKGAYGSYTTAILDWKVINFGKVSAGINAAKAEKSRVENEYENELFLHQIKVADLYLLFLINQQLKRVQEFNLQRAEDYMKTVNARVSAGLKPGVDSALAHAEYTKAELMLLESQRNELSYALKLIELSGGDLKDSLSIDTMNFFKDLPSQIITDKDNLKNAPSLRLYQSFRDLSKAKSISIKRSFYPSLSVIGTTWARGSGISRKTNEYRRDFSSGVDYQVFNYLAGVALRWNLTSYFKIHRDYKSEMFQYDKYQLLYDAQVLRQSRELKDSDMQFNVALKQAQLSPIQLEAARAAFEQAQIRYSSGLTDLPTFTQSLLTLNRAEADNYIAYSNAWRALLMKAAAAGDLSLFLNQVK
ncbi:TolC family protein [Sporocytophaga myxococcoides]|nr:TolC family protein [Sporocytophaga myxococcoides]